MIKRPFRALQEIEIEQSDRDFKIFDEADNLRIYYFPATGQFVTDCE
jgi:hypothetical protein